ncbi:putative disease resistance RPP13-like protein 1 [Neltuma alba]|uniref:putative disease resistance RPP13-like protein 1 n=1 Tax=Neltuma alba TaxID=207710 RepID=UPI0010A40CD4|nr:putative disease resistance RPP13-like protein 1 [Prosopis alba]
MAGELLGGTVLSAFLQMALDRLVSRETLQYLQKRGLNETLVKKLKIMLLSIDCVIDDAEDKQFNDSNVKALLLELKDVVYDPEDVLDDINYAVYKRKLEVETSVTSKVRKFFCAFATSFDQAIESRVKQVLENLEFFESRKIDLGLKQDKGGAVRLVTMLPTTSLVDEVGIYGKNEGKEIITKRLLNDGQVSVISMAGMGGLGKTKLAQLVYIGERIQSELDLRAWACVSNDFDVEVNKNNFQENHDI